MSKLIVPDIDAIERRLAADDPSMDSVEFEEQQKTHRPLEPFAENLAAFMAVCSRKHTDWGKEAPKKWMAFDCKADEFNDMVQHPEIGLAGFVKHLYTAMGNMVDMMHAKHYAEPQTFFIEKLDGNAGWRFHLSPYDKEKTNNIIARAEDERKAGKIQEQRITKTDLDTGRTIE